MITKPAQARIEIWRGGEKQISDISQAVIDEMVLVHPLLPMGIGGVETLRLLNPNGLYSDSIIEFDDIKVYLWREGDTPTLRFAGKIMKPIYEGDFGDNEFYLNLICEDIAQEMLAPPALPQKKYVAASGKTILDYLVGLLGVVTLDATDDGSGMTAKHDIELNESGIYDGILDVIGKQQFDAYTDPLGKLHVFARGSKTSSISLSGKIYRYVKSIDVHRIRNKLTVYGAIKKTLPTGLDDWCEQEASETPAQDGWEGWNTSPYEPAGTFTWGTDPRMIGNECVKITDVPRGFLINQTFPAISSVDVRPWIRTNPKKLVFWLYVNYPKSKNLGEDLLSNIRIVDGDGDYYGAWLNGLGYKRIHKQKEFIKIELPFEDPVDIQTSPVWNLINGTPNLADIQKGQLYLYLDGAVTLGSPEIRIDGFHFAERQFSDTAEDPTSQGLYGVRCAKPIVDTNLTSDAECQKRAEEELEKLKTKVVMLENLLTEGDFFVQGYKQLVQVAQDNIDGNFLIGEVKDILRYTTWDSQLTFIKEL